MSNLEEYDTETLQAELERREKEEKERAKPRPLDNPDWDRIYRACQDYIEECHVRGYEPKDSEHFIYEITINSVYGPEVWYWINDKVR